MKSNRNLQSKFSSLTLTAGEEKRIDITGSSFRLEDSNGRVAVRLDDGGYMEVKSGSFFNLPDGDYFRALTFKSLVGTGGGAITIKYYAGTLPVGNNTPVVYTVPKPTYIVQFDTEGAASAAEQEIAATHQRTGDEVPNKLVRVHFMQTGGTANRLHLQISSSSEPFAASLTGVPITIEVAEAVKLVPYGGNSTYVCAAFYELPT
jgi:hypothetical protein